MKKFELRENKREVKYKDRVEIKAGCTLNQDNQCPKIINAFDSKEEALEALKAYKTEICDLSSATGTYYSVTEYYVEENEYDEEGEWSRGGDIYEFSKLRIGLVEKPSYKTFGIFDNFADAIKAYNECEEECFISFSMDEKEVVEVEMLNVEAEISRLEALKKGEISELQNKIQYETKNVAALEKTLKDFKADDIHAINTEQNEFCMEISGVEYKDKKAAGEKIISIIEGNKSEELKIGTYRGFDLIGCREHTINIRKKCIHSINVSESTPIGIVLKIDKSFHELHKFVSDFTNHMETEKNKLKVEEGKLFEPFSEQNKLDSLYERKKELEKELGYIETNLTDRKKCVR